MTFIKKKWVDVPDPSNLPAIPSGQDALARFDAANMNRIEEGIVGVQTLANSKAPIGHGLGETGAWAGDFSFQEFLQQGGGFYQIKTGEDTPLSSKAWMSLIQVVRTQTAGKETGAQLAFYDFTPTKPQMWLRTVLSGNAGNWVEMLHTGNAVNELSKLGMARFASSSYVGTGTVGEKNPTTIKVPFKPKLFVIGADVNAGVHVGLNLHNESLFASAYTRDWENRYIKYENGTIFIYYGGSSSTDTYRQYNRQGDTYYWYAFG